MSQSVKDKRAKARPGRGPRPGSVNAGDRGRGGQDGSLAPLAAPRVLACPGGRVCSCTSLPELRAVGSGHGSRVPLASRWRGLERSQPRPAPQSTRQDRDPRGRTPAPSATPTPTPPEALSSSGAGSCRGARPSPRGGGGVEVAPRTQPHRLAAAPGAEATKPAHLLSALAARPGAPSCPGASGPGRATPASALTPRPHATCPLWSLTPRPSCPVPVTPRSRPSPGLDTPEPGSWARYKSN